MPICNWILRVLACGLVLAAGPLAGCGDEPQPRASEPGTDALSRRGRAAGDALDPDLPEVRHNALLVAAERLEQAREADPAQIDVLRELIMTYVGLLIFEGRSGLGSNVAALASARLDEFTVRAAPLKPADQAWADSMRGWLHYQMRQYPLAAAVADEALQIALDALHQDEFFELTGFQLGPLKARVFRTLAKPPSPSLLWPAVHVLFQRTEAAPPHHVVTYALARRGAGDETRWYLHMHDLNRSRLVRIFGRNEPSLRKVLEAVRLHAQRGLALAKRERQG